MEPSWNRTSHQGGDSQGVGCFTDDVMGHTGCCMDGMCLELWGRDILSVKKAKMSVPLHPPPLQGSDVLALLMIVFERELSGDTLAILSPLQNLTITAPLLLRPPSQLIASLHTDESTLKTPL